jgi:hypothetical protein
MSHLPALHEPLDARTHDPGTAVPEHADNRAPRVCPVVIHEHSAWKALARELTDAGPAIEACLRLWIDALGVSGSGRATMAV